jgi:hypothetical protein
VAARSRSSNRATASSPARSTLLASGAGNDDNPGMIGSRAVVDDEAIATVLRLYIEGVASGDAAKLTQAFHEHARTYGSANGTRYDISDPEMISIE